RLAARWNSRVALAQPTISCVGAARDRSAGHSARRASMRRRSLNSKVARMGEANAAWRHARVKGREVELSEDRVRRGPVRAELTVQRATSRISPSRLIKGVYARP